MRYNLSILNNSNYQTSMLGVFSDFEIPYCTMINTAPVHHVIDILSKQNSGATCKQLVNIMVNGQVYCSSGSISEIIPRHSYLTWPCQSGVVFFICRGTQLKSILI